MMDEQRTWLKSRRKRRLRTLAVILSVCVLFTSSPHIWETVSVFAAEESEGEGRQYISGFAALSEEVREQSVPLGTELHELSLPDALEAYITVEDAENSGGGVETPGDSEGGDASADEEPDDEGIESDDSEAVSGENEPDGSEENNGEETSGDKESDNGDHSAEEESDGGDNGEGNESDNEGAGNEENGPEVTEQSETGNADQAESDKAELKQETYTVTMPEYHAENAGTVEVKTLIGGVTWNSTPAYDGDTAGTYTFTAALPEGYTLAEGVSMPEIRVTVQDGSDDTAVQELLARIAALPEAEEILAKEPEAEDEEAYEEWTAELSVYGEEAFAILEAYEDLTAEQQAQIPGEAVAKLMAWVELVDVITGGQETYALGDSSGNCGGAGYESAVKWTHNSYSGKFKIEGNGPMADYASASAATWTKINPAQVNDFTIGSGITHIGNNAFAGVKWVAVPSVTIPATVSSIGTGAFPQSGYLTAFIMEGTDVIPELGERCFSSDCTITITNCSYYDAYCNAPGWSAYKDNIRKRHKPEDRESISAKEPTCMEEGNTAYWRCGACGDLFADEAQTIPTTLEDVTLPINADNHSYTYSASGAVITESCANGCGHSATATLSLKSGENLAYTGSAIKPVTVTYSDGWGGTGTDYKPNDARISYSDNTDVGTATAELAIGGATATVDFQITEADMTVTASGCTGTYDGSAHGITVTVPADATVKYGTASGSCTQNASPAYTNVGTYTVYYQVTKPNYRTVTGSAKVIINARSISDAAVTLDSTALTYNGSAQTKGVSKVTVTADGKPLTLTAGTDYTISGNQGTDAKSYTMTLTGKGNYTGTKKVDFTIAAKPLTAGMVTVAGGPHYYTGNAVTPAVTVKDGSRTLAADTDYMVSYNNNTNAGTATVTVAGKGNYTGTVSQTFTIQYDSLPADKKLTDYVTVSPAPTDDWYGAEITLTPKNGCEVGETPSGIGSTGVIVSGETGTDGTTKTIYVKDENGHIYQTAFPYKLDKTPPVIDLSNMSVTNGTKGLWNWIIGKKSMVIHIPEADITDALSGIKEVTYTAVPDDGAQQTQTIRVKGDSYEISLNAEFSGIIKLTAQDKAGNSTEVSLTTAGGKVVAEDYAPIVKMTLPDTPEPNENGWYNTTVSVDVTVTDDKNADDTGILSGGIAEIKWKDGENGAERTVAGLPGTSPVYEKEFAISVDTDGAHTYYVKAVDNAGNASAWQTIMVKRDTGNPVFTKVPEAGNHTQEGADITFTPSEGGKAYWLVNPETTLSAQEVVEKGAQNNCVKEDMTGGSSNSFTLTGLTPGESHTVYVVLEDAAGNLSEVKAVSFLTLQKAPEISLGNLVIDHEKETVKIPDGIGEVEVYTDPENPSGSKIRPDADGFLPVEPGTTIYIRYPEKTQGSESTPASDSVTIDIPGRPAAPSPKQVSVTDTTVTVTDPVGGEEYILVPKGSVPAGQEPDWSGAEETGAFTGLDPNQEYELWVRKKPTGNDFASEPSKTEVKTYVTVKEPVIEGDGAGKDGNTASKLTTPDADGGTVPFTGTYGEEYTPVIKVGDREIKPETTWDERAGKGTWEYPYPITEDENEIKITVEFRKRTVTAITVTPESLKIYADHAANRSAAEAGSMAPLTEWLKEECIPKAAYDNKTEGAVQGAVYTTAGPFAPKGSDYSYTVTAEGKTTGIILTVMPVNAAVTAPSKVTQMQKSGGYTQAEVAAWLPAQVTVTYTGTGYTTKTESRAVIWNTSAIDAGFGGTLGEKTVSGTADLPDWATGQTDVSVSIAFVDKQILTNAQMNLSVSGWIYGAQKKPVPRGSVSVADTNPIITYLYSADSGVSWTEAERLPRSGSGYIVPGAYQAKMTYTGDGYMGTKTAAFTVEKRTLTVEKGTLEAENKNYDGTLTAALKEGGAPALTGVLTGDTVTAGGTLRAEFAEAGPKKDIAVTVTGFELEGQDAGYYVIGNTSITLQATINKADGTPPSDGKPGTGDKDKNKDKDKETGGNVGEETGGSDDGTGNGDGTDNGGSPKPVVSPKNPEKSSDTPAPAEADRPAPEQKKPETGSNSGQEPEAQPTRGRTQEPKKQEVSENQNTAANSENQNRQGTTVADNGGQSDGGTVRSVTATADQGRIAVSGDKIPTGNVVGMEQASTEMALGDGAVFVTVVCEDARYAAGVKDTAAVANAVLSAEQIQLVNDGETIEIRVDVKDISEKVPENDKEVIENGLTRYQEEVPALTLGRYVDISMFMKIGESDWDAITSTEEPIEVVIGIPEDMREDGREFYIIRAHGGEHTFMRDLDEEPDTITISTDMFSSYAIAYAVGSGTGRNVCGLCHICPTFLGVCCFIWLAAAIVILLVIAAYILRRKREE